MPQTNLTRALSTHAFVEHRLTTVWLDRVWQAGIPLVEIFCARQHLDYRNRAQVAAWSGLRRYEGQMCYVL